MCTWLWEVDNYEGGGGAENHFRCLLIFVTHFEDFCGVRLFPSCSCLVLVQNEYWNSQHILLSSKVAASIRVCFDSSVAISVTTRSGLSALSILLPWDNSHVSAKTVYWISSPLSHQGNLLKLGVCVYIMCLILSMRSWLSNRTKSLRCWCTRHILWTLSLPNGWVFDLLPKQHHCRSKILRGNGLIKRKRVAFQNFSTWLGMLS